MKATPSMGRMWRRRSIGAAMVAVAASLIVVATTGAGQAESGHGSSGPKVFIADRDPYVIDQPPASTGPLDLSAGDVALFDEPVETLDTGHALGAAITRVQVIDAVGAADSNFIIDCTVHLPDGDLLFSGAELFSHLSTVATVPVVGGTGKYSGAKGQVRLRPRTVNSATGTEADFDLVH
ncbi:MAG TPA: dirigent protein [Actinomycetota bacterium]|nr:dirigent protein [Actinomycetota bacterium]